MARRAWIAALAALAVAAPGSAATEQYWGLSYSQGDASLHRVDPITLRSVGPSLRLGTISAERSLSPDGSTLAVVAQDRPVVRFVDLERMRVVGEGMLADVGEVHVLRWTHAASSRSSILRKAHGWSGSTPSDAVSRVSSAIAASSRPAGSSSGSGETA